MYFTPKWCFRIFSDPFYNFFFFFLTQTHFRLRCLVSRLPRWLSGKEFACCVWRCGFHPWVRKISWRRKWQPTSVFLPGKFRGQRGLAGYIPWGLKETDRTEHAHTHFIFIQEEILFLFKVGMDRGGDGAGGFCIVIIFKDTKFVMEKKDKIEDLVFKILNRFCKQMYLWVFFLQLELTEKWAALVFCKLYNYIHSISNSWGSKRTFQKGALR